MGDAMTFTRCSVTAKLDVTTRKNLGDLDDMADPTDILNMSLSDSLSDGRGNNQGNLLWFTSGSIAASGSQAFDLVGSLTTAYGDTVNFDRVKGIFIKNTSTTNSSVIRFVNTHAIFGAAGDYINIRAGTGGGGFLYLYTPDATGYDITAGTVDTITLTNLDATYAATYQIGIIGAEIDSSSSSSSSSSSESSSSSNGISSSSST